MIEDHSKHDNCAFPDEPCNQLTFAEAMAMDPVKVEVENDQGVWWPLALHLDNTLRSFRECRFRRAIPRRSRIQEMADRKWPDRKGTGWGADISAREETVLTIVDWLLNGCQHGEDSSGEYASVIAREFLGVSASNARAPLPSAETSPSPWTHEPCKTGERINDATGKELAIVRYNNWHDFALMVASPDLGRALQDVTDEYEGLIRSDRELTSGEIAGGIPTAITTARALLAKLKASRLP